MKIFYRCTFNHIFHIKKTENNSLVCIVHYPKKDESKYSALKQISARNEDRIRLAKSERETYNDDNFL